MSPKVWVVFILGSVAWLIFRAGYQDATGVMFGWRGIAVLFLWYAICSLWSKKYQPTEQLK